MRVGGSLIFAALSQTIVITEFCNIFRASPQISSSRRSYSHFFAAKSTQHEFLSEGFRRTRVLREAILIFLIMQTPLLDRQSKTSLKHVVPGIQKKDTLSFAMAYYDNSRRQKFHPLLHCRGIAK
jgi:hypothetical protein